MPTPPLTEPLETGQSGGVVPLSVVTRAVVWNQALWTAGYALTTGGFFNYFARELGAGDRMMALLLVIPETVGILALATRPIVGRLGNRKRTWLGFSLFARLVSIGIPLLAFARLGADGAVSHWMLAAILAVSQGASAIAYVAMISWFADLVPEARWGRFFARQQIAEFSILLFVPIGGGMIVDWWKQHVSAEQVLLIYVVAFSIGIGLLLASMIPLLRLPAVANSENPLQRAAWNWDVIVNSFRDRSLRYLLIHNWWLAAANGMTQAVFFGYLAGPLGVTLSVYQVLSAIPRLVGIPASLWTGSYVDRYGNKRLMILGVLIAGGASMLFWLLATPEKWWWVVGAYLLWGLWPTVNIPGRNLVLKLSPPGDNTTQFALFRNVGGLIAGLSGLLGGLWLAELKAGEFEYAVGPWMLGPYQLLFIVSLIGRFTAAFWLIPVNEMHNPDAESLGSDERCP